MLQRPPYAAALRARERAGRFRFAHGSLRHIMPALTANQGGTEAPAWTFIVRRRFAHHRSIAFSAARIASRLAPSIEPSRGLGGV